MISIKSDKSDVDERPFEELVMELHSKIGREMGKKAARHYLKWANGILVFFPKDLRNIVVQGYGRIIAHSGTELGDFYFSHLKELFRLEQKKARKDFPLTARAAEEGATLLCEGTAGPRVVRLLRTLVLGKKLKRNAEELFQKLKGGLT